MTVLRDRPDAALADSEAADVALAASGDARAFERLYRLHVARIHSLARRMVGPEDADELTQDVFVRAWQKLSTFKGQSAFGTWLYRLAINLMLGRRASMGREKQRLVAGEAALDTIQSRRAQPELTVDFERAVELLPDGARKVFVLHDVEGFKHDEIADMLDVTTGTSKAQLHRARMMLRRHLDP